MKRLLALLSTFPFMLGVCSAEDVVSTEDIIKSLKATTAPAERIQAIDVVNRLKAKIAVVPRGDAVAAAPLQTPEIDALATLSMEILFEYDSVVVKNQSLPALVQLGNALISNELAGSKFLLIGHTDAKGARQYNVKLSERRALAIKDFLQASFPASQEQLTAIGFGEEKPLNLDDPESAKNRRVQIVNLGSSQ